MSQKYVIGVDGGGTKTLGLLMNEKGEEVARTAQASSNIHSNPHSVVEEVMHALVESLCTQGNIKVEQVDFICLGMAGCDSPKDREVIESFLRPIITDDTGIEIINDAIVAARAVLEQLHGLLLIAGTGSICFGWNKETGKDARCGGWGHLLADEGSGYAIGMEALKAILQEVDGRGPKTSLTPIVMEDLNLDISEPRSVIQFTYGDRGTKARIASIARFVMQEAEKGDQASLRILNEQADELIKLIPPPVERLFGKEPKETIPLGIWGGNLVHVELYRNMFMERLNKLGMPIEPKIDPNADAVIGAAKHALILLNER